MTDRRDDIERTPDGYRTASYAAPNPATAISAEGARVAFVPCEICGAAILLDPRDPANQLERHRQWHERSPYD